jgi:hypothetical protein
MTLDRTTVVTLTESALSGGAPMHALAERALMLCGSERMILVVPATPREQAAIESRVARTSPALDVEGRAALITLAARENSQRFAGLFRSLGVDARLLDPLRFAPITRGNALEAEPRLLHARRYESAVRDARVLVIAGGVGRSPEGRLTSLGTGGASLSGLFIAQRLGLEGRLIVGVGEYGASEAFELPRRASLFARRHGLHADLVPIVEPAQSPEAEALPA